MLAQGSGGKIAILVRKRGALANLITDELTKEDVILQRTFLGYRAKDH